MALHKVQEGVRVNLKESIYRRRTKRVIVSGSQAVIKKFCRCVVHHRTRSKYFWNGTNCQYEPITCKVMRQETLHIFAACMPYWLINKQLYDYTFASGALNRQVRTIASTYNYLYLRLYGQMLCTGMTAIEFTCVTNNILSPCWGSQGEEASTLRYPMIVNWEVENKKNLRWRYTDITI